MKLKPNITAFDGKELKFPPEITSEYAVEVEAGEDPQVIHASVTTEKGKLDTYGKGNEDNNER